MNHEEYMGQALELARQCLTDGDVPVGCVITSSSGQVIGLGRNLREQDGLATAHLRGGSHQHGMCLSGHMAADRLHPLCHSGAMSHVCWSHHQRPHPHHLLRR